MSQAQSLISFNFGNPASLPAGASCSTSTSCTIVGATYFNVVNFTIPAGVTVRVTGNTPLNIYANNVLVKCLSLINFIGKYLTILLDIRYG